MCQLSTSVVSLHVGDDISFCLATPSACSCEMRLDDGRFLWLRRSDGVSLGSVCVCVRCVCVKNILDVGQRCLVLPPITVSSVD